MLKLMSPFPTTTPAERIKGWRERLWDALPEILVDDDLIATYDTGEIAIRRKFSTVYVGFEVCDDDFCWGFILAPLVYIPREPVTAFYRALLEINSANSNFGTLSADWDIVRLQRTLAVDGLNDEGLKFNVAKMVEEAEAAAYYLVNEFGARRFESRAFDDCDDVLPTIAPQLF